MMPPRQAKGATTKQGAISISKIRSDPAETKDRVIAGAGGIGGGSLLLLIAEQFPQGSMWNQLLKYFAPWATALGTAGWLYLQGEFLLKWQFKRSLTEARSVLERDLKNANISQ